MSSVQSSRRPMNWHGRPVPPRSAATRRNRPDRDGFVSLGLRIAGLIGSFPKWLWPYLLPWIIGILAIIFICLGVRDVRTRQLLVPPVETPQSLSERGYSSAFLAERIMASMREIGQDAESIPHDTMTDNDARPDIQIPGPEMSYASTVRFVKGIVNRPDVVVHVGITKANDGANAYVAHVRIEGGPFNSHESAVPFEGPDLEKFIHDIAVMAMRLAEPNILASHLFTQVQNTRCSLAQCDYREIVAIYDEVITLPGSEQAEWAHAGKAWLLTSQKLSRQAEQETREALTTYKDSAVLRASLGVALEQQNRIDDAIAELRAGANEKSKTAENLRLLGDVLLHAKRNAEALSAFRQAYEMNPDSVNNLHDWGEALVAVGDYDTAIDKLSSAVKLRPDLAPSYETWGRALDHKGDLRGAARKYAQALQLDAQSLTVREIQLARLADTDQDGDVADAPKPDARTKPVSNPPAALPFQASLEARRTAGWTAMPTA
ncbi:putative TPR repeat protein [Paraburkholderia ribeironis]|uniref:Putative TPR repeat protein n=1 Tax=Paraburkholderia ribeironis TaxID=1247936 RepID=A0A1N7S2Q9_9BURK|nr:tetratricopeptide repeat protein [Paraburkholderia ribeironis]SIT41683.1 putative TPR repeat protein [Paraburkholderia ribeironis]